jgi:hypothetical protein
LLGNRIIAARPKRVAPQNAAHCKPAPAYGSMPFECLDRVRGTAWIITARWRQKRRQRHLISANDENEKRSHMMALRELLIAGDTRTNNRHIELERTDRGGVCLAARTNGDVEHDLLTKRRKQFQPHQLPQSPFEPVPVHRRVLMSWHHDRDPWKRERGSEDPHIEMRSPNSLPLANDGLNVVPPRQTIPTRKS